MNIYTSGYVCNYVIWECLCKRMEWVCWQCVCVYVFARECASQCFRMFLLCLHMFRCLSVLAYHVSGCASLNHCVCGCVPECLCPTVFV